jgi:hypothetical protein
MGKLVLIVSVLFCTGCLTRGTGSGANLHAAHAQIAGGVPGGWRLTTPAKNQRAWESTFATTETDAFTLVGPKRSVINWVARDGKQYQEDIVVECIFVWLVPTDFRPKFPLIDLSGAQWPERLGTVKGVAIYVLVSTVITNEGRLRQIEEAATEVSSPSVEVSWSSWKRDIPAILER